MCIRDRCNTVGLARSGAVDALKGRAEIAVGVADRFHASVPWTLDGGLARPLGGLPDAEAALDRAALAEMAAGRLPLPLPAGWPAW